MFRRHLDGIQKLGIGLGQRIEQKKALNNVHTLAMILALTAFSSLGLDPFLVGMTTSFSISERLFNVKGGIRPLS